MTDRFAFVVPLRNPSVANNWDATVGLCVETLRSLVNCNDPRYEVILVCREFPDLNLPENVTILRYPFPEPEKHWEGQHIDKYLKIKMGLVELRKRGAYYYVMKFDADDLASKEIVPWVLSDGNKNGYVIEKGYRLNCTTREIIKINSCFHKACGSSNILYATPESLPASMDDEKSYDLLTQGHNIVVETFLERGKPLTPVSFPAVIYRTQTSENITSHYRPAQTTPANRPNWKFYVGKYIKKLARIHRRIFFRRISKNLVDEFRIPREWRARPAGSVHWSAEAISDQTISGSS